MKRYNLLLKTLDALEHGRYCGLDVYWCGDTIDWLWRWRKISKEEMQSLCERVIALCEAGITK